MVKNISLTLTVADELYKLIERYDDGNLYKVWCQLEHKLSFEANESELEQIKKIINMAQKDGKDVSHLSRMLGLDQSGIIMSY